MPELPEVETVLRGLKPHLLNTRIQGVIVRTSKLRWAIPANLSECLIDQQIMDLSRRAKYLLVRFASGTLIIHLGMSGRLCLLTSHTAAQAHDHVDILLDTGALLRYTDPRRFGAILWTVDPPLQHSLLHVLGPEPLEADFTAQYLKHRAAKRSLAVKSFIMDGKIVVGVGNIYAAEALFTAQIHPLTPAGQVSDQQWQRLVTAIREVLEAAVRQGGTTLKDFVDSAGKPGYFTQQLQVYGRAGLPCRTCNRILASLRFGQRSTVFCEYCQKVSFRKAPSKQHR